MEIYSLVANFSPCSGYVVFKFTLDKHNFLSIVFKNLLVSQFFLSFVNWLMLY